jgi:hypothetical protein
VKIRITRRSRYEMITGAIYACGLVSWWSAVTGHVPGGMVLLTMAVAFNAVRDTCYPFEVRGFPPA